MTRRVGLTGGIASGKSSVSDLLRTRWGVPVLDLDRVSREVATPGTACLAAIVERFGPGVLAPGGTLDRVTLRQRVAGDPTARQDLEAITHPHILAAARAWLDDRQRAGDPLAVVETPLLVEAGMASWFDVVVVVVAPPETQVQRLVARSAMAAPEAHAWLAAQASIEDRIRAAHVVIENGGTSADLERAVEAAWPRMAGIRS